MQDWESLVAKSDSHRRSQRTAWSPVSSAPAYCLISDILVAQAVKPVLSSFSGVQARQHRLDREESFGVGQLNHGRHRRWICRRNSMRVTQPHGCFSSAPLSEAAGPKSKFTAASAKFSTARRPAERIWLPHILFPQLNAGYMFWGGPPGGLQPAPRLDFR